MEPVIRQHEAFWVMGLEEHAKPDQVDYRAFWGRVGPRLGEIGPVATGPSAYGVYFPCADGLCDVFGGLAVPADAPVPDGMVKREVPAAEYAVFECDLPGIAATWAAIYSQWLPASGYAPVETQPCFEVFEEGCHEGLVPVRIWTAVTKVAYTPNCPR